MTSCHECYPSGGHGFSCERFRMRSSHRSDTGVFRQRESSLQRLRGRFKFFVSIIHVVFP